MRSFFEVYSSTEEFGEGGSDEGGGSVMGLDLVELCMDLSDELFGEGVGFGVEKEIEDISFLFENGILFKVIWGKL